MEKESLIQSLANEFNNIDEALPEMSKEESEIIELIKKHGKLDKNALGEDMIVCALNPKLFIHDNDYDCDFQIDELNVYHGRLGLSGNEIDGWWCDFLEDSNKRQLYEKIIAMFRYDIM